MNLSEVTVKYGCLVVFIRHDSAEISEVMYGLALGIENLKITASNSVLLRVVCALKRFISCDKQTKSVILTYLT
jgi:hypothetical protein